MTIKTVAETAKEQHSRIAFWIAKKGKKYLTWRNRELSLSINQSSALVFASPEEADRFIGKVTVDTRNAETIGRSFSLVEIFIGSEN